MFYSISSHVSHCLTEEIKHGAMLGPLTKPPIDYLHVSTFMTWDNASSEHRRVIIYLNCHKCQSINSGVISGQYLDTEFMLTYPSIDNITDQVLKLGRGCQSSI